MIGIRITSESMSRPSKKQLYVWGYSEYGCLGLGNSTDGKEPRKVNVPDITWAQISCGPHHTAAVSSNGELFTWGGGFDGKLGHGDFNGRRVPTKVEIPGGEKVVKVACGSYHTAAVTATGKLLTWYVSCLVGAIISFIT